MAPAASASARGFDLTGEAAQFKRSRMAGAAGKAMRLAPKRREIAVGTCGFDRRDLEIELIEKRGEKLAQIILRWMHRQRFQQRAIEPVTALLHRLDQGRAAYGPQSGQSGRLPGDEERAVRGACWRGHGRTFGSSPSSTWPYC